MQTSRDAATEQERLQIWHIERMLVRPVTTARGNASRVEPLVLHGNFAGRVKPGDVQFSLRVFSFARKFYFSARSTWLPEDGLNILEIELAAIPEIPCRLRKAGHAGLRVDLTVRNFPLHLRQGKR